MPIRLYLCAGGSQALVGELVDFLTASVIKSQTNVGLALALKASARLRHHCLERARAAALVEPVQAGVRPLADRELNSDRSQLLHKVGVHKGRRRHPVPEVADGRELRIVSTQEHMSATQGKLGHDVEQGHFAHKSRPRKARL